MVQQSYRPEQRKVTSTILTRAGWMIGTFHVPMKKPFLDFLNAQEGFFTLTDVGLRGQVIPFLAVSKSALMMCEPPPHEQLTSLRVTQTQMVFRQCVFLLEEGVLQGTIQLRHGQRISDHLQRNRGFLAIQQVRARFGRADAPEDRSFKTLIINPEYVVGVSDQTRG